MVDEIVKLAKILDLPNLEDETIKLINAKIRSMIDANEKIKSVQEQVQEIMQNTDLMNEWLHGNGKEGE